MKTYLIVDTLNTFMRARHIIKADTPEDKAALGLHVNFMSLRKCWEKFNADHVVFCLEGKSWRKTVSPKYKANRVVDESEKSLQEIEEDRCFWETYENFTQFISEKTNATVLRHPVGEADDMIARWIANHPDDKHIIVSSDSDFVQLVSENVTIYNGIRDVTITPRGVFDDRERLLDFKVKNDGKIQISKSLLKKGDPFPERRNWIDYALFCKIVRGDAGDNIMTACEPRTRQKGSSKKAGILECFNNREDKGFEWFNFMNHRWTDHEGNEHVVRDRFAENEELIDLKKMPPEVKEAFDEYILNYKKEPVKQMGFHFLKFVAEYDLAEIQKNPGDFVEMLNARNE